MFGFAVCDDPDTSTAQGPDDGCFVRGLCLEGTRWDSATPAQGAAQHHCYAISVSTTVAYMHTCAAHDIDNHHTVARPMGCDGKRAPFLELYSHLYMRVSNANLHDFTIPHVLRSAAESRPKELFTELPRLWLRPERTQPVGAAGRREDCSSSCSGSTYDCPLYKTLTRAGTLSTTGHSTNYIISVKLPSGQHAPGHWINRGAALFCALAF